MNLCPICGYDRLLEPPLNFTICPSCGTEFGYDDAFASHGQLRRAWLTNGAQWWSPVDVRPNNWDPLLQVAAVESSIWEALRTPLTNREASTAFGGTPRTEHHQSQLTGRDPLSIMPKQAAQNPQPAQAAA